MTSARDRYEVATYQEILRSKLALATKDTAAPGVRELPDEEIKKAAKEAFKLSQGIFEDILNA